jgi:SnoaL-like domain
MIPSGNKGGKAGFRAGTRTSSSLLVSVTPISKLVHMDSVEGLLSLEEIRKVKYRYLRCIDMKLWHEIGEVFTDHATLDYGTIAYGKPLEISGRSAIVAFFRLKLGPDTLTAHAAGQPEITVDGDTATGIWSLRDTVLATRHRMLITGAAFYQDRYERGADGRWRIAHTGYVRTYEAMFSLDDLPSFKVIAALGDVPNGQALADAAAG